MYSKIKSIAGLALVIIISGLTILAFVSNNTGASSNEYANKLAQLKVQEIQAEQQLQLWTAKKTATTKAIAEMNGKISEQVKLANPEATVFPLEK